MTEATRQDFHRRAEAARFPTITLHSGSRRFEGPDGWQRLLDPTRALTPFDLTEIERQLAAGEQQHADRVPRDVAEAVEDERRAHLRQPIAPGDPEHAEVQRMLAQSAVRARYAASTEGKLDRLIELNERIVAALQK